MLASIGFRLQTALILATTGIAKLSSPEWTQDGTALTRALEMRGTAFGRALLDLPAELLSFGTTIALGTELIVPVLLFVPSRALQTTALLSGAVLMAGIALTMQVGPLPVLTGAAIVALWPTGDSRSDGDVAARATAPAAIARILLALILTVSPPLFCARALGFIGGGLDRVLALPAGAGLEQSWQMFSRIPRADYHLVRRGQTISGLRIDPADDPMAPPGTARSTQAEYRMTRLEETLISAGGAPLRSGYARYLCSHWNSRAEEALRLESIDLLAAALPAAATNSPNGEVTLGWFPCAKPTRE